MLHRAVAYVRTGVRLSSIGLTAVLACTQVGTVSPKPYSCGDLQKSHCYGEVTVGNHATGFRTMISVVNSFQGGTGFLTNEFWIFPYDGNLSWIEIGYQASPTQLRKYFWATLDPTTSIFRSHDIGNVPTAEVGSEVTFDVHQTGEHQFALSVQGNVTHFDTTITVNLWDGTYGGYMNLGQELAGDSGAVGSLATFKNNQVYDGSLQPHFITDSEVVGSESQARPPFAGWLERPAMGNRGGVFSTWCCTP